MQTSMTLTTGRNDKAAEIERTLAGFSGSEDFYRIGFGRGAVMTDGVQYLCEAAGAHWLTDVITSHQTSSRVRAEPFQVWTLRKIKTPTAPNGCMIRCEDGNGKRLVQQRVVYTDFPLDTITLYFEVGSVDGTTRCRILMLPGER